MAALMARRWPAAREEACLTQRRFLLQAGSLVKGAAHVRHAAPIAAIDHAIAPAGPLAAATTWAAEVPTAATLTRPAEKDVIVLRLQDRRNCWFIVLLGAGVVCVKDFTPACEVGNIKSVG